MVLMPGNRLEILRQLVEQNPGESRTRFMLAMELAGSEQPEAAAEQFVALVAAEPGYVAAYYHGGQVFERLGRLDDARDFYTRGLEAAERAADRHARDELQVALELLG